MSIIYYLNEDHTYRPCGLNEWAEQFETIRQVADDIINNFRVSTVWVGINVNFGEGPPLLFETMIFKPNGEEIYCEKHNTKYSTWDQAIEGHQEAINWVKNGCKDE